MSDQPAIRNRAIRGVNGGMVIVRTDKVILELDYEVAKYLRELLEPELKFLRGLTDKRYVTAHALECAANIMGQLEEELEA